MASLTSGRTSSMTVDGRPSGSSSHKPPSLGQTTSIVSCMIFDFDWVACDDSRCQVETRAEAKVSESQAGQRRGIPNLVYVVREGVSVIWHQPLADIDELSVLEPQPHGLVKLQEGAVQRAILLRPLAAFKEELAKGPPRAFELLLSLPGSGVGLSRRSVVRDVLELESTESLCALLQL